MAICFYKELLKKNNKCVNVLTKILFSLIVCDL